MVALASISRIAISHARFCSGNVEIRAHPLLPFTSLYVGDERRHRRAVLSLLGGGSAGAEQRND